MKYKHLLPLYIIVLCSGGCTSRSDTGRQIENDTLHDYDELAGVKEVYYRFPSPDEMLNFISIEDLNFNENVILPVENANKYLDSKSQSLNLGVYVADLAYINLFQRQKEALTYFQVIYGLSDKLRISSAFTPGMLKRFEDNLGNIDSLKKLADQSFTDITEHLVRQEQEKVLVVISVGGFIETLYLAFNMVEAFSPDNMIVQRISDQKRVVGNILNYALQHQEDKNVKEAIILLEPLQTIYDELDIIEEETKVNRTADGRLVVSGGERITISEAQYYKLREATFTIRKKITGNQEN